MGFCDEFLGLFKLNGKGHAITTLVVAILISKWMVSLGVGQFYVSMFVMGAFMTCHSADVWGISAFSPDMDLLIDRKLKVNIHRKWYFHSFILSLPMLWAGAYFLGVERSVSVFLFGMAFGWNSHIIEDDLWSRFKHHRKQPFPLWVEVTSLLTMFLAVLGVLANFNAHYYTIFANLYEIAGLGVIPSSLGYPLGTF